MTREPLPWDDPNHDVGSDMIAMADHLTPVLPYAAAAATHLREVFGRSQEAIDSAMRHLHVHAAPLVEFAEKADTRHHVWTQPEPDDGPRYRIDTTRRRPVYSRFSEADITLNRDRIGAEYERLAKKHREDEEFWRIQTSLDVISWINRRRDPRYRTDWPEQMLVDRGRPRGCGKTREHAERTLAMMTAYGEAHAEVGPGYFAIYDETRRWAKTGGLDPWDDEVFQADVAAWAGRFEQVTGQAVSRIRRPGRDELEPYVRVFDQAIDDLADRSGTPRELLGVDYYRSRGA